MGTVLAEVLIVSNTEKSTKLLSEILSSQDNIVTVTTCTAARRIHSQRDFEIVIINAPLSDESGETLSRFIAANSASQVILIVKAQYYDEVTAITSNDGVLTVAKPINKVIFLSALNLAKSAANKINIVKKENVSLKEKIREIKIIDRAKCLLISYLGMEEKEAHRYIEKQAMDLRETKVNIAKDILKTYEQ